MKQRSSRNVARQLTLCALVVTVCGLFRAVQSAQAQAFSVVYSFEDPPDGAIPEAGLVVNGNYGYGTTYDGGVYGYNNGEAGYGTIFNMSSNGKEAVVHNFSGAPDGANPSGTLAHDSAGNLYGATHSGGSSSTAGEGTVFKLGPSGYKVLHIFTGGDTDGAVPVAPLLWYSGNLYGTTSSGGASSNGTAFKLTP